MCHTSRISVQLLVSLSYPKADLVLIFLALQIREPEALLYIRAMSIILKKWNRSSNLISTGAKILNLLFLRKTEHFWQIKVRDYLIYSFLSFLSILEEQVAARFDLVDRTEFGGVDGKITNYQMMSRLEAMIVGGPSKQDQIPFDFKNVHIICNSDV